MVEPIEESYFVWLYSQIGSTKLRTSTKTYWSLARQLHQKEFVWVVPNDDNRVADGRQLRYEFLIEQGITEVDIDAEWMSEGCSFLEMLIALSRRLWFEDGGDARDWFWRMLDNLGIDRFNDRHYNPLYEREINETLENVIWRNYSPDGRGGLFPLKHSQEDQRDVEIAYQFSAYLIEQL